MRAFVLTACLGLVGAGCVSEATTAPCSAEGTCLDGFTCVDGSCLPCEGDRCPAEIGTELGPSGGSLCEDNEGICLVVPPSALARFETFSIKALNFGVDTGALRRLSPVYEVTPVELALSASVEVRVRTTAPPPQGSTAALFRAENKDGPWLQIPSGEEVANHAVGRALKMGYFVAGAVSGAGSPDAGVTDGGA